MQNTTLGALCLSTAAFVGAHAAIAGVCPRQDALAVAWIFVPTLIGLGLLRRAGHGAPVSAAVPAL